MGFKGGAGRGSMDHFNAIQEVSRNLKSDDYMGKWQSLMFSSQYYASLWLCISCIPYGMFAILKQLVPLQEYVLTEFEIT